MSEEGSQMRTIVIAAGILTLAACASGPGTAQTPAGFDASADQFTGWVRVTGGEFQLFSEQRDLRNPAPQPCISGALPRNAQQASGDISGSQVRFTGRTLPWAERNRAQTHDWQGSDIVNGCRRDVVILADRVEVLR
jgi:hypothetical protein